MPCSVHSLRLSIYLLIFAGTLSGAIAQKNSPPLPAADPFCPGNRLLNGDFDQGNTPGGIFGPGHIDDWTGQTGVCEVFSADGCGGVGTGSVGMLGRMIEGDMMWQHQPALPIFEAGKTYSISLCARYMDDPPLPLVQIYVEEALHVRFRITASDQILTTYNDPAGVIVGETPQLTVNGSWVHITLPNWTAPADYHYITVNQFNDNPGLDSSYGEIDKICISEVTPLCPDNVVLNGDMNLGNIPGGIYGPGHLDDWMGALGVPEVFGADGCNGTNAGSVGMLGRADAGDMMYQQPGPGPALFQSGKTYSISLCARYLDDPPLPLVQIYVDEALHVRFRLSASNGVLGSYADPGATVIGETPQLTVNGTWVSMTLPDWTAPSDFLVLSVNQFNDNPWPDSSYGEIDKICITEVTQNAQYAYRQGWNLISQPMIVSDDTVAHLFPSAISPAYAYFPDSGYVTHTVFLKPNGYWLKFPAPDTLSAIGTTADSVAVPVKPGWNLVGSATSAVAVGSVSSSPGGLITSPFYGYNLGYAATDSIRPGLGYWVHVADTGYLIIDADPGPMANRIAIVPGSELPPPPPGGAEGTGGEPGGIGVSNGSTPGLTMPADYALRENFPNPFNPVTVIAWDLPVESRVRVIVFDALGREIAVLAEGVQSAGTHTANFDAGGLTSGIYFYRLVAAPVAGGREGFVETGKMVLMR